MRKVLLILLVPFGVAWLAVYGLWWHGHVGDPPAQTKTPNITAPVPLRVEARWLLTGEVFWGRQMERIAAEQENPQSYLFSKLNTFDREQYDAWIGHMECPIADTIIPFDIQANSLIFNCDPSYVPEFAKWFTAVSLANNHIDNVSGIIGLKQTRANLEKAGVQYYGHFDNSQVDEICEVVSLPARIVFSDGSQRDAQLPVALCGYHNVFSLPTEAELDVIRRFSDRFLTIVSPQQGAEYQPAGDEFKQLYYRAMIDRGADMVVASHPHWVQNTESYKGKLIMYSVGNFMFDQEWSDEVKRGVALDVTISVVYDDNLRAFLELEDCNRWQDNCNERAMDLIKPSFGLGFDIVSVLHENGLSFKAPEAIHQLNLDRLQWSSTLQQLDYRQM